MNLRRPAMAVKDGLEAFCVSPARGLAPTWCQVGKHGISNLIAVLPSDLSEALQYLVGFRRCHRGAATGALHPTTRVNGTGSVSCHRERGVDLALHVRRTCRVSARGLPWPGVSFERGERGSEKQCRPAHATARAVDGMPAESAAEERP